MSEKPQRPRWNWKMMFVVVALALVGVAAFFPFYNVVHVNTMEAKRMNDCRQIIISIVSLSGDSAGDYPDTAFTHRNRRDARNSNEALRELFKHEVLDDERAFGGRGSPFIPDGEIGEAPDFREALQAGENHWAMTTGLSISSAGNAALVYENPADASWPPKWKSAKGGKRSSGDSRWDKVIVGRNDGSVAAEPLWPGVLSPLANSDVLFPSSHSGAKVLNVEK